MSLQNLQSLLASLPALGAIPQLTQLGNGQWVWAVPAAAPGSAGASGVTATASAGLDQLASSLVPVVSSAVGAANPLAGAAIPVLFAIGKAIHDQLKSQPPGTNPSMQTLADEFHTLVTHAFPLPGLTQQTAPMAG